MSLIDIAKVVLSFLILLKASVHDVKTREVPDELWLYMIIAGLILDVIQYILHPYNLLLAVIQFVLIFALANFMFYVAGFGGADAKALIALSVVFPVYPRIYVLPLLNEGLGIFAFSVLANSVIVAPVLALIFFLKNVREKNGRFVYRFIGYRVPVDAIPKFHNLLEYVDENGRVVRSLRGIEPDEEMLRRLAKAKKEGKIERVWVTPALPFLVFMTAGFVVSVILGDLMVWFVEKII